MPCAILSVNGAWVIDPDSAVYVGLSRSILSGEGYSFQDIPHSKYPPFFPLLLASAGKLSGEEDYAFMQFVIMGFWVLLLFVTYFIFSGYKLDPSSRFLGGLPKSPLTGLLFALLMGTSIYMIQYAVVFLRTEIVFSFFSLTAVWTGLHLHRAKRPGPGLLIGFVLAFLCAYFTRMAGIALLGALILVFVPDKKTWVRGESRWILAALLILLCALGPVLWFVRNKSVATNDSTDYAAEFTQRYGLDLTKNRDLEMERIDLPGFIGRVKDNAMVFSESCAKMMLNSNKGGAKDVMKLAAGALCIFGLIVSLVRRRSFVDYYCLLYLGLYFIWPFNQQQRFYMPILPFLFEYAAITLLLLNRLLPALFRHKGVWFLFFALQVPLLVIIYSARSEQIDILGRYSYHYMAFAVLITVVLLVVDIFLIMERARPGGVKFMVKTLRLALPLLFLLGFTALGFNELRVIARNHQRFLEHRVENPVPQHFESIETHPTLIEMAHWIRENTGDTEVIMSDIPKMLHLLTGRRTVPFTFYSKQRKLADEVHGLKPAYVCYSGEIGWIYYIFKDSCKDYEMIISHRIDAGAGEMIEPGLFRIPQSP
ncbi:MAG: hypothetical protein ACYTG7_07095 [Planctomycetota bacterium]